VKVLVCKMSRALYMNRITTDNRISNSLFLDSPVYHDHTPLYYRVPQENQMRNVFSQFSVKVYCEFVLSWVGSGLATG
jgi:hypothetical protein